jgi:hypothetical protein
MIVGEDDEALYSILSALTRLPAFAKASVFAKATT